MNSRSSREKGYILASTMLVTALLLSFLGAYYTTSHNELVSMRYSKNTSSGFYAAEAGLNIRAEEVRAIFKGYNAPLGSPPNALNPCQGSNNGSGDYKCKSFKINNRDVFTYVTPDSNNPVNLTVPPGEIYQNLNAQEYRYVTKSFAMNSLGQLEANLELHFRVRLIPLFQFAAFYEQDLEILPGNLMKLAGPVHTNSDLYINAYNRLSMDGQITVTGDLYRGRKDGNKECTNHVVEIKDPLNYRSLLTSCSKVTKILQNTVKPWNGMIDSDILNVVVPKAEVFDPEPGKVYWERADLRLGLQMNAADNPTAIKVYDKSGTVNEASSTQLDLCLGATDSAKAVNIDSIYNYREKRWISLLDIDIKGLLDCLHTTSWFGSSKMLSDRSDGGLVFHFTVKGPKSTASINNYGIRIRNGQELQSSLASTGAPLVSGLTVVSDQAVYLMGDYNSTNKIPAAIMADSLNVLSNAWNDSNSNKALNQRVASNTIVNAAFLSGNDFTGNKNGPTGQGGAYSGGLENYPRFHEAWSGRNLLYRGSFVSLGKAQHVGGKWSDQSYNVPVRDWNYDVSFNNASNLPPLTPRFVYLKQELFVRDFNQVYENFD
jgi:hypothetical protein